MAVAENADKDALLNATYLEKLSSFVDKLLQPIAQQQKSYIKDTTDFVYFIKITKVPVDAILVSVEQASTQTYRKRREYSQYAEHMKYSTITNLLSYTATRKNAMINLSRKFIPV